MACPTATIYLKTDADSVNCAPITRPMSPRCWSLAGKRRRGAEHAKTILAFRDRAGQRRSGPGGAARPAATYHMVKRAELEALTPASTGRLFSGGRCAADPGDRPDGKGLFGAETKLFAATSLDDLKTYLKWHAIR